MNVVIDIDLRAKLTKVRDQGARPTCLAFASTTAHEHARQCQEHLSPEYLYYFASNKGGLTGLDFSDIVRALEMNGQPVEEDCPYQPTGWPPSWVPPKQVVVYRRLGKLLNASANDIVDALQAGHLAVLGISIPDSFFTPSFPWAISDQGPIRGLHAVVAVGLGMYSGEKYFLVRNSWGCSWGDQGYAWLGEDFISTHLKCLCKLTDEVS